MRVSVVIPAYNEEKYIGACLESLMKQTVTAFEIIVVDNNSTDRTAQIARSYEGVTVIKELKKGTTPTRNAGFNAATGDIIARTDADTRVPEDWIEHVENLFVRNSIDAVSGLAVYYDAPIKTDGFLSFYFWISKHLFKHPILLGPNFAITRDIWNKVKNSICTDDTKVHDDIDISIHIAKIGGTILYEPSLKVECSARRILKRPHSFFLEYAFRYVRMLLSHAYK